MNLSTTAISGHTTPISLYAVEIIHSWISDLKVSIRSPEGTRAVLHDHEGNDGDDIIRTWTSDDFTELQRLHGEDVRGDWTLHIVDKASADVGRLLYWHLDMGIEASSGGVIEDRVEPKMAIPDANAVGIASMLVQTQAGAVKEKWKKSPFLVVIAGLPQRGSFYHIAFSRLLVYPTH